MSSIPGAFRTPVGGLSRQQSSRPAPPPGPSPFAKTAQTPLSTLLPQFRNVAAYFHQIDVAAPSIATSTEAWYGLRRIRADQNQEFSLSMLRFQMRPCDVSGAGITGPATPLAWGDSRGISAAIIVGRNLPFSQVNVWTGQPAYVPGIDAGGTANAWTKTNPDGMPDYFAVQNFPTGQWSDTACNVGNYTHSFGPNVARVPIGDTLDIALVMRSSYVNAQTGTIVGMAHVSATIQLLEFGTAVGV